MVEGGGDYPVIIGSEPPPTFLGHDTLVLPDSDRFVLLQAVNQPHL